MDDSRKFPEDLKCTEKGCVGVIDENNYTTVQTGCHSWSTVHACNTCGRLHFVDRTNGTASGAKNRQDQKAFLLPDGNTELR